MAKKMSVVYTARGFRQDAAQAMRDQIHRALIELITNSDDAYGDQPGEIKVDILEGVDGYSARVVVTDHALGLDAAGMATCFGEIGAKNSKLANGGKSRGLLGRGAKDVAVFGKVHFQSIRNGKYSDLELDANGEITIEFEDSEATDLTYADLGIPLSMNGLKATIFVSVANQVTRPTDLLKQLRNNAQLRDLIKNRSVIFSDYRSPGASGRLETSLPQGKLIKELKSNIDGYEGEINIAFYKLDEIQSTDAGETTANGLLLKSGSTIFENTWFGLSRPETRLVAGYVEAPQIEEVLRAEIESDDPVAVSLLSRSRDGLTRGHKLYEAIARAVKIAAHPVLEEIAAQTGSKQEQGENLTRDLKIAAQALKSEVLSILRDFDDEPPVGTGGEVLGDFEAIPGTLVVAPNQTSTITLRATEEISKLKVVATSVLSGLIPSDHQFGTEFAPTWEAHSRLDRRVTQWKFKAPQSLGIYTVEFKAGVSSAQVQVIVREPSSNPSKPPTTLEFKPAKVQASPGRGKNLLLRAPLEYASEIIAITSSGIALSEFPQQVSLKPNLDGSWVEAVVHCRTSSVVGIAEILAIATDGVQAKAELTVAEAGVIGAGPSFDFKLKGDSSLTRYSMDENNGSFTCYVYGQHPSFCGVFGRYSDSEKKFINEDEPVARAIMAEAIAQAFAQQLVEIEFGKRPEDGWDPVRALTKSRAYVDKLVRILHRSLVQ